MHSADVCYGLSSIVGPKAWLPDLAIQHTFSQLATDHDQATCWDAARMRWVRKTASGCGSRSRDCGVLGRMGDLADF